ncbi:MAG: hypothetical protein PHW65_04045 [Dehalococcoidales bacterium]|nr:hypothetical protein [Dehalococcoidales bacterium]
MWHEAFRRTLDLRIRDGTHHECRWFLRVVDPDAKEGELSGPQWFGEMIDAFSYVKSKENAGLVEVMNFEALVKMHCPEVFD